MSLILRTDTPFNLSIEFCIWCKDAPVVLKMSCASNSRHSRMTHQGKSLHDLVQYISIVFVRQFITVRKVLFCCIGESFSRQENSKSCIVTLMTFIVHLKNSHYQNLTEICFTLFFRYSSKAVFNEPMRCYLAMF